MDRQTDRQIEKSIWECICNPAALCLQRPGPVCITGCRLTLPTLLRWRLSTRCCQSPSLHPPPRASPSCTAQPASSTRLTSTAGLASRCMLNLVLTPDLNNIYWIYLKGETQHFNHITDPDVIWTRNLLIWSQMHCRVFVQCLTRLSQILLFISLKT